VYRKKARPARVRNVIKNEYTKARDLFLTKVLEKLRASFIRVGESKNVLVHWLTGAAIGSAKETALISLINIPISLVAALLLRTGFFGADGFILLLEAAALMLVGGAIDLGASASGRKVMMLIERKEGDWNKREYQKHTRRASFYTLAGLFLFGEALVLAVLRLG
jgi:hypothetical protein